MTFKTRTVTKRGRRRTSWQQDTRRNLVLNIAFVMAIIAALAILGGVLFSSWYGDHWASVMTVSGKSYSLDDLNGRAGVLKALDAVRSQTYADLRNAGKIGESDYTTFTNNLSQQGGNNSRAVSALANEAVIADYAKSQGISVDDNDVKTQIDKDATVSELRHIKVIAVRPTPKDPATVPTQADIDAAQQRAQNLLDQIKGGAKWDDIAKQADAGFLAAPSGDQGTGTKQDFENSQTPLEAPLLDAAFSLKNANDMTAVMKGQDGIFRFATVTSIVPPQTDPEWESKLQKAGANLDAYHAEARAAALQAKVKDKIVAQYATGPTTQRHVLEMYFNSRYNSDGGDEVKARFMVFAPGKDPSTAATLDAKDPKWDDAKKRADDVFAKLQADPTQFAALAKTDSDEKTWAPGGGELPFLNKATWDQVTVGSIPAADANSSPTLIQDELFKPDMKTDQLIGPTKTDQGYVIMQYIAKRPGPTWRLAAARLQMDSGADFAAIAKQVSDATDASSGGDMGWVANYQLETDQQAAIFSTKVGEVSGPVEMTSTDSQGQPTIVATVLFKVLEEQTRTPTPEEAARLRNVVYSNWFQTLTQKATRDMTNPRLQTFISADQASSTGQ